MRQLQTESPVQPPKKKVRIGSENIKLQVLEKGFQSLVPLSIMGNLGLRGKIIILHFLHCFIVGEIYFHWYDGHIVLFHGPGIGSFFVVGVAEYSCTPVIIPTSWATRSSNSSIHEPMACRQIFTPLIFLFSKEMLLSH